mgnify:CR=1 FL=1
MGTKSDLLDSLDPFTKAYLVASLWSSTDESTPQGGEPLDKNYEIGDFTQESLLGAIKDCRAFQADNITLLEQAAEKHGFSIESAGHDFWLTRNGHGAGFWDRGLENIGYDLTKASKAYGGIDLYVYRGKIYGHEG